MGAKLDIGSDNLTSVARTRNVTDDFGSVGCLFAFSKGKGARKLVAENFLPLSFPFSGRTIFDEGFNVESSSLVSYVSIGQRVPRNSANEVRAALHLRDLLSSCTVCLLLLEWSTSSA